MVNMNSQEHLPVVKILTDDIINKEKLSNCDVTISPNTVKGNGYAGKIYSVHISGNTVDGISVNHNVIIKASPTNRKLRESVPISEVFKLENFIYKEVHPLFEDFQKFNGIEEKFYATAYCYGTYENEDFEGLALEDLKFKNYKLWNRKVPMNVKHVKLVLDQYAKLHAISLCLREKQPNFLQVIEEKFKVDTMSTFFEMSRNQIEKQFDYLKEHFHVDTEKKVINCLVKFKSSFLSFIKEDIQQRDEYSVILHGDCWCNNMMFKYENCEDLNPSHVCFLDWQVSRFASPMLDFSYFLYTNSSKEIIEDDEYYLKFYYRKLSEQIKKFGCDGSVLFPWQKCKEQWKKYSRFGLLMALTVIKIMLSEEDEVPDLTESAERNEDVLDGFFYKCKNEEEYLSRVKHLILHFSNKGLLD